MACTPARPQHALARQPTHTNARAHMRQATHDGYLAQEAAAHVAEVEVAGGGRRLSCWPPLLSTFSKVTRLVLRGHFLTALPHSVGDMQQLRVRAPRDPRCCRLPWRAIVQGPCVCLWHDETG